MTRKTSYLQPPCVREVVALELEEDLLAGASAMGMVRATGQETVWDYEFESDYWD